MKTIKDNDITNRTYVVYVEKILYYRKQSGMVQFMKKKTRDINVFDCIGTVYIENETKLSWLIE